MLKSMVNMCLRSAKKTENIHIYKQTDIHQTESVYIKITFWSLVVFLEILVLMNLETFSDIFRACLNSLNRD